MGQTRLLFDPLSHTALSPGWCCWCPTNGAPAAYKGPPLWLPGGGALFYHSSHLAVGGGGTSWKTVVTAPHLRQHRHLHMCCCCHSIYPDRHFYTCANKNPHFKPGTPCKFNMKSSCIHLKECVPIKTKTVWKFNITLITACKSALAPTVPSTN